MKFAKRRVKERLQVVLDHPGQRSFVAFVEHVRPDLSITPQLRLFASKIEKALLSPDGGWLRLMLVLPPGTGKTWIGKLFLAWCFGLHPDWHELVLCLSAELAKDIGGDVRNTVAHPRYREVFPTVRIPRDSASKKHFEIVDKGAVARGEFNAAGRNTRFTGRRGKVIYQDDLINEKEADSQTALADAKNTIDASRSRGHPAGFHWLVVNTRYREDDPIGYMLDKYRADGPWDVVTLPVMFEEGDLEHPAYAPTMAYAKSIGWRIAVGDVLPFYNPATVAPIREGLLLRKPHEWFGQYKGLPRPPTGRKVDASWFQRYTESPAAIRALCERVVFSVDTAVKDAQQNDPSAILVWGEHAGRRYLLHVEVVRLLFDGLLVLLARMALEWKPQLVVLEDAGSGAQIASSLRTQGCAVDVSGGLREVIPWSVPIELVTPVGNKVLRFYAQLPAMRQGTLFLPAEALWLGAYLKELLDFPRVQHDDQCDATALYLRYITEHGEGDVGGQHDGVPPDVQRMLEPHVLQDHSGGRDIWQRIRY